MNTKETSSENATTKVAKETKAAKVTKLAKEPKSAKSARQRRLTLSEINSTLYVSGKTTIATPVEKVGSIWSTSSTITTNGNIIEFKKSKGVIIATINDENPQTIIDKNALDAYVEQL